MAKSSLHALERQIEKLQAKAAALRAKNKKPTIQTIVKLMQENDISIEEISAAAGKQATATARVAKPGRAGKASARKPVPIKYRNPHTDETWTGRGRTPRWIVEAEQAGKNRSKFAV